MASSGLREPAKSKGRVVALVLAIVWAIAIFLVSSIPGDALLPGHPEPLNVAAHFTEYVIFAVLLSFALNGPKRPLWKTALLALVIASLFAVSDEFHQWFVPGRFSDWRDWLTDTCGALLGAVGSIWFISAQKVKKSRARDGEK